MNILQSIKTFFGWTPPQPIPVPTPESGMAELLHLHNQQRTTPLTLDAKLTAAAQKHADWMHANKAVSHNEGLKTFMDRLRTAGYHYTAGGENVAMGYKTPAAVVAAWVHSPGHLANIVNPSFRDVGFGKNGTYWCADFGTSVPSELERTQYIPPGIVNPDTKR